MKQSYTLKIVSPGGKHGQWKYQAAIYDESRAGDSDGDPGMLIGTAYASSRLGLRLAVKQKIRSYRRRNYPRTATIERIQV